MFSCLHFATLNEIQKFKFKYMIDCDLVTLDSKIVDYVFSELNTFFSRDMIGLIVPYLVDNPFIDDNNPSITPMNETQLYRLAFETSTNMYFQGHALLLQQTISDIKNQKMSGYYTWYTYIHNMMICNFSGTIITNSNNILLL